MFTDNHNMDTVREIKEESLCMGRISNKMNSKSEVFRQDSQFEAVYLSDRNNKTCSENKQDMKIKEEPYVEGALNGFKLKMEDSQISNVNLQNIITSETECKKNTSVCSDDKFSTKIEIKEEPMWEERTSQNTIEQRESTLDLDPLPHNDIKATVSCLTGIGEDFPSAVSPRLAANISYNGFLTNSALKNEPDLRLRDHSSDFKKPGKYEAAGKKVNDASVCVQEPVIKTDILPHHTTDTCSATGEENLCKLKELQKHQVTHSGSKPYICDICGKNFKRKSNLKTHILSHTGTKPCKCTICDKSFKNISMLKMHQLIHSDVKPHKCDKCDRSFTQKAKLKNHALNHFGTKPYKCDLCEKTFTQLTYLKCHMAVHSGTKPFKCDICDSSFKHKSSLNVHSLTHSGEKPCKCTSCERSFKNLSQLKRHELTHSDDKPYKCNVCERSFTQNILKSHVLIHFGTKPYKCEICEKRFNQKSILQRHNLTHSGTKAHKCDICEKSFSRLSNLKRHKIIH